MKRNYNLSYLIFTIITITICFLLLGGLGDTADSKEESMVASDLIRFHVLANSDTPADQELKNHVKDVLANYLQEHLIQAQDINEARDIILLEMSQLEKIAAQEIAKKNFAYSVQGELELHHFPTRMYGETIYPAGEYQALRIIIGEGKGENWWCVLFPNLCFIDGTKVVAKAEDDMTTTQEDTEEDKQIESKDIVVKIKLLEIISKIFKV